MLDFDELKEKVSDFFYEKPVLARISCGIIILFLIILIIIVIIHKATSDYFTEKSKSAYDGYGQYFLAVNVSA